MSLLVLAALVATAGVALAAEATRIKLEGFEGYFGVHNWGHHTAPFALAGCLF